MIQINVGDLSFPLQWVHSGFGLNVVEYVTGAGEVCTGSGEVFKWLDEKPNLEAACNW